MSDLVTLIWQSRQTRVEIGGHHFTVRRPTPMEALEWLGQVDVGETQRWFEQHFSLATESWRNAAWYAVAHFVDDWDLQEIDIVPGGTGAPVPFDAELLRVWLMDHPAILNNLAVAVFQAWAAYLQARDVDQKKSTPGSTIERSMSSSAAPSA